DRVFCPVNRIIGAFSGETSSVFGICINRVFHARNSIRPYVRSWGLSFRETFPALTGSISANCSGGPASPLQFIVGCPSFGDLFGHVKNLRNSNIRYKVRDSGAASQGEQTHLACARLAPKKPHHALNIEVVGAR